MPSIPNGLTRDQFAQALARLNPAYAYRWLSETEYEWRGPDPSPPSDAAITTAWQAQQSADQAVDQLKADRSVIQSAVLTAAQSAVGIRFDQLTAAQVRALFAIVLWESGALDGTGKVRPLAQWVGA